jgi:2-polyprenyl-3-methyl-5-hydroxy-6-metoxy-1,4-benzoquinol methylase
VSDLVGRVSSCPVCGGAKASSALVASDVRYHLPGWWPVIECETCGLAYLSTWPGDDASAYPSAYTQHELAVPSPTGGSRMKRVLRSSVIAAHGYPVVASRLSPRTLKAAGRVLRRIPVVRARAESLMPLFPEARSGGRLLDFGCGNGTFLKMMEVLGWDSFGIERDERSADIARSLGLRVSSHLEICDVQPGSIDVVTLNHVIEHVRDPIGALGALRRFMTPGGILGIATPNWDSFTRRVFGPSWYALDPPRHLMLHTARSIRSLCIAAGLDPVIVRSSSAREGGLAWRESFAFATGRATPLCLRAASVLPQLVAGPLGYGEELIVWATKSA